MNGYHGKTKPTFTGALIHVCSYGGDIEVLPDPQNANSSIVRYISLTGEERLAMNTVLPGVDLSLDAADIVVPRNHVELAQAFAVQLRKDTGFDTTDLITAVKFADGEIVVSKEHLTKVIEENSVVVTEARIDPKSSTADIKNVLRAKNITFNVKDGRARLLSIAQKNGLISESDLKAANDNVQANTTAVQVRQPVRGCPMPTRLDIRDAKALEVVSKFLTPVQRRDFAHHRAFLAVGCDTGNVYRITSRWAHEVGEFGVLYDIEQEYSICASQLELPPSEECLSMKFAIENFEDSFINGPSH